MENIYKTDYPLPIRREWNEQGIHQRKQCEMNKLRVNTSELSRLNAVAFRRFHLSAAIHYYSYLRFQTDRLNFFNHCMAPAGPKRILRRY